MYFDDVLGNLKNFSAFHKYCISRCEQGKEPWDKLVEFLELVRQLNPIFGQHAISFYPAGCFNPETRAQYVYMQLDFLKYVIPQEMWIALKANGNQLDEHSFDHAYIDLHRYVEICLWQDFVNSKEGEAMGAASLMSPDPGSINENKRVDALFTSAKSAAALAAKVRAEAAAEPVPAGLNALMQERAAEMAMPRGQVAPVVAAVPVVQTAPAVMVAPPLAPKQAQLVLQQRTAAQLKSKLASRQSIVQATKVAPPPLVRRGVQQPPNQLASRPALSNAPANASNGTPSNLRTDIRTFLTANTQVERLYRVTGRPVTKAVKNSAAATKATVASKKSTNRVPHITVAKPVGNRPTWR